jgi:hypothetical protein
MTTVKAPFGGRIPFVNLEQGTPIPGCFVRKLSDKVRPTHVTERLSQAVVVDHVLDLQALDTDDLVFMYDANRELVVIVSSAVCHLLMDASNLEPSFVSLLRACFLPGMPSVCLCQLLLVFGEELGIAGGVPIGGDDHRLQAQIEPYHLGCDFQGSRLLVTLLFEGGRDSTPFKEVAPCPGRTGVHSAGRKHPYALASGIFLVPPSLACTVAWVVALPCFSHRRDWYLAPVLTMLDRISCNHYVTRRKNE